MNISNDRQLILNKPFKERISTCTSAITSAFFWMISEKQNVRPEKISTNVLQVIPHINRLLLDPNTHLSFT